MSKTMIRRVEPRSPAAKAGVQAGETLVEINGKQILDVLDYKFYSYDARLTLTLQAPDGASRTLRVRKEEGEDLGLEFETYLMDRARSCANNCIFCFVDQMPPGMRESLYFKDDDARLSFLMGNYLTLTNLSQREVQRIIDLRISPINVSVHTTDRSLRVEMLKNRRAGESIEIMRRFARHQITMNCQIVSCPGINDGPALDRTLRDLAEMFPAVHSVSVVPVGVTKYREGLYPLRPYTREEAGAVVDQVEAFAAAHRDAHGTALVWCSDEFYLLAGRPLPEEDYYEGYRQLENGVGMLRSLGDDFLAALDTVDVPEEFSSFTIATGTAAAPFLTGLVQQAQARFPDLRGEVVAIDNDFFGHTIDVAGLLTGQDISAQLQKRPLGDRVLIPLHMLRHGETVFLDDYTVERLSQELGRPVQVVGLDGFDLADALFAPAESRQDNGRS